MYFEFEDELKEIIVSCGDDIDISKININSDLIQDFSYTSINIIQMVVAIEDKFNIIIDDQYLVFEKLSPYSELIKMLKVIMSEQKYVNKCE